MGKPATSTLQMVGVLPTMLQGRRRGSIVERFGRLYNHAYSTRLFNLHLPCNLIWQHKREHSEVYRAPRFSQASVDGPVEMRLSSTCPPCNLCSQAYAKVVYIKVDHVNLKNVYGQVEAAGLYLRGYLVPCRMRKAQVYGTGCVQIVVLHIDL